MTHKKFQFLGIDIAIILCGRIPYLRSLIPAINYSVRIVGQPASVLCVMHWFCEIHQHWKMLAKIVQT